MALCKVIVHRRAFSKQAFLINNNLLEDLFITIKRLNSTMILLKLVSKNNQKSYNSIIKKTK